MLRASLSSIVFAAILLPSALPAQDLPDHIIKYFAGKWTYTGPDQGQSGTMDLKVVAGGKALAGPGTDTKTGDWFTLASWHANEKTWIHDSCNSKQGKTHLEVNRFENDTYYGKARVVDETGKLITGDVQAKIIDPDHYEYTVSAGTTKLTSRWTRQK